MKTNLKTKTASRQPPVLKFSPTAWSKLLFLRDLGETEIGAFGISSPKDLLLVEDVQLVTQTCTWAHVEFGDESVANFFDDQVDAGRQPETFGRLWLHTHPGSSAEPSGTDEITFARVFGRVDWAVMFILARGGQTYARLRYNVGPGAEIKLPVEVDFSRPFEGTDFAAWEAEYLTQVKMPPEDLPKKLIPNLNPSSPTGTDLWWEDWQREAWEDYLEQSEAMYEPDSYF